MFVPVYMHIKYDFIYTCIVTTDFPITKRLTEMYSALVQFYIYLKYIYVETISVVDELLLI